MSQLKELSAVKKAIKRKVAALKVGEMESAAQFEKTYKPIIEPLQQLASTSSSSSSSGIPPPQATSTPRIKMQKKSLADDTMDVVDDDDDDVEAQEPTYFESLTDRTVYEDYNPLPRKYIEGLTHDIKREYDPGYGVRYDPELDKWLMGDKEIMIDGDDLLVITGPNVNSRYNGTPGLYELIFKKVPTGYTNQDMLQYAEMLKQTNSYRQKYDPSMPVKGNASSKYKDIIKPLLKRGPPTVPFVGRGYDASMVVDDRREKYVYFDNYDELVDRMRLLYASKEAGNNGHDNEIASIIEELREARIIY